MPTPMSMFTMSSINVSVCNDDFDCFNFSLLVTIMLSGEQKTKVELVLFDVHVDTIYYLHVCNHIIPNLDYCKHVQILILIQSFQIICITLLT